MTNEKVDLSKPFTIRWTAVEYAPPVSHPCPYHTKTPTNTCYTVSSSDPQNFTITLVNQLGHRVNKDLATRVDASDEEYVVERVWDIPVAYVFPPCSFLRIFILRERY
jgi:hypothetical protein